MNGAFFRTTVDTFLDRFKKPRPIWGSPREVCTTIIEQTWNGTFFQTGMNHFNYFWIRDFGIVTESLVHLGHRERVHATLRWVLERYQHAGAVHSCMVRDGATFDAPVRSIDALPWLLHAVHVSGMPLSDFDHSFLTAELSHYEATFLDPETGKLQDRVGFAELRDAVRYVQSAYDIAMLALLKRSAAALGLNAPLLQRTDYAALLRESYWNGKYFDADIDNGTFSSECNLFPFWLGVITDESLLQTMLTTVHEKKLTDPYPMHYTDKPAAFTYRWWQSLLMPHYASDTIWTWQGAIYLQLLAEARSPDLHHEKRKFDTIIYKYHTFPELLTATGHWYKTPFYQSERGIIWAALYLDLLNQVEQKHHADTAA